jgi:hypothetical protein
MMATFGIDVRDVAQRLGVRVEEVETLIYEFCTLSSQVIGVDGFVGGLADDGREALIAKLADYCEMDLAQVEAIEGLVRGMDAPLNPLTAPEPPAMMTDAQKKSG